MRPVKLTMEGFTSFADRTTVDFGDLDLFAITGPTGSGKTSVLDAMTWALFGGTARGGKSADLISHSASAVKVCLEFSTGGAQYRISRTARRAGASQVRLEKRSGENWVSEEAAGIRETDAAVVKILGLDFETFTRAVVLPQGDFDRFLRGDHKDRRDILKKLLNLEIYDRMRESAQQRWQELAASYNALQALIERDFADATDDRLRALTVALREARRRRKEIEPELAAAQKLCLLAGDIERVRLSLAGREAEAVRVERARAEAVEAAARTAAGAGDLRAQGEAAQREHDAVVVDERRSRELIELRARSERLEALLLRQQDTRRTLDATRRRLVARQGEQEQARVARIAADDVCRVAQQTRAAQQAALEELTAAGSADLLERLAADLEAVPEKLSQTDALLSAMDNAGRKESSLRVRIAELHGQGTEAEAALAQARQDAASVLRHAIHCELRSALREGQPCPVCEQTVAALPYIASPGAVDAARGRVEACEAALRTLRDDVVRCEAELASTPPLVESLRSQAQRIEAEVKLIRSRVQAVTRCDTDAASARALASKVAAIRSAEQDLKRCCAEEAAALKLSRKAAERSGTVDRDVAELSATVAALVDESGRIAHEIESIRSVVDAAGGTVRISAELQTIEAARERKSQLSRTLQHLHAAIADADRRHSVAERTAAVLAERVRSLNAQIAELSATLGNLQSQWNDVLRDRELPEGRGEPERAGLWLDRVQAAHHSIQQRIASLEADTSAIKTRIERLAELRSEAASIGQERDLYEQMKNALRADRFIDYLLSRAYEDLCCRGSQHLLRLSGERYSFTAGKNTFHVKDAWHGDAERPAGTLSGGESFLASLALALALSESVASFNAESAPGRRLDTLFLDEGVSTLDQDEALPAVVDALMQLQAGDRMIGIISHMENLAHRLPARIEIVRNHGRSTVRRENGQTDTFMLAALQ
jgi:DNA repair protein SbcC/Rad50